MKVCFAVEKDEGINSAVYGHFGSAPTFVLVDTDTGSVMTVGNNDLGHVHGACNPIQAIGSHAVDAVVVGGIGAGAISGLNGRGIKVYGAGVLGSDTYTLILGIQMAAHLYSHDDRVDIETRWPESGCAAVAPP